MGYNHIAIYTVAVRWLYSQLQLQLLQLLAIQLHCIAIHSLYHYIRNQLTYTHIATSCRVIQLQPYSHAHTINTDQLCRYGTDVILPCAAALTKPKTARVPAIKMKQLRRLKTAEPLFCMSRTIATKIINTAVCQHISLKLHRVSIA